MELQTAAVAMHRTHRADNNASALYQAARKMGFRLNVTNNALCDAVAQLGDVTELWEVKNGRAAKYTPLQARMREAGWQIRTIRTVDDLLQARSEMVRNASAIQRNRLGD